MPANGGRGDHGDMGFLNKLTGGVDKSVLANGVPGRGAVMEVRPSGTTMQSGNGLVERACTFTLEVTLDGVPPYLATCKQRVPEVYLPQLQSGGAVLAVKADPADHSKVVLDLEHEPPTVTMAADPNRQSAADIIANGRPAKGVIVESQALGMKNPSGIDMCAFLLTVAVEGEAPYQVKVATPPRPRRCRCCSTAPTCR
jgi:hypothetical protein